MTFDPLYPRKIDEKDLGAQSATEGVSAGSSAPDAATARHTEGPWIACSNCCVSEFEDPQTEISHVKVVVVTNDDGKRNFHHRFVASCADLPERKANAHLIAAAPEMKDALRDRVWAEHDDATHWPKGSTRHGHSGDFETCAHIDCRLIAKAEGRS